MVSAALITFAKLAIIRRSSKMDDSRSEFSSQCGRRGRGRGEGLKNILLFLILITINNVQVSTSCHISSSNQHKFNTVSDTYANLTLLVTHKQTQCTKD